MGEFLLISDAAKEVKVESHVLRYWEEELKLPIKRNELGHRYYTYEDVERFKMVKNMKDQGLQLKAIRRFLTDGKLNVLSGTVNDEGTAAAGKTDEESAKEDLQSGVQAGEKAGNAMFMEEKESKFESNGEREEKISMPITIISDEELSGEKEIGGKNEDAILPQNMSEKAKRLQWLLQQLIRETLQENNKELSRDIKESIVKELDYQFRVREEKEEERERRQNERDEEYYRKIDEILRSKNFRKAAKQAGLSKEKAQEIRDGFNRKEKDEENRDKFGREDGERAENKTIDLNSRKNKKQKFKFFIF